MCSPTASVLAELLREVGKDVLGPKESLQAVKGKKRSHDLYKRNKRIRGAIETSLVLVVLYNGVTSLP